MLHRLPSCTGSHCLFICKFLCQARDLIYCISVTRKRLSERRA